MLSRKLLEYYFSRGLEGIQKDVWILSLIQPTIMCSAYKAHNKAVLLNSMLSKYQKVLEKNDILLI